MKQQQWQRWFVKMCWIWTKHVDLKIYLWKIRSNGYNSTTYKLSQTNADTRCARGGGRRTLWAVKPWRAGATYVSAAWTRAGSGYVQSGRNRFLHPRSEFAEPEEHQHQPVWSKVVSIITAVACDQSMGGASYQWSWYEHYASIKVLCWSSRAVESEKILVCREFTYDHLVSGFIVLRRFLSKNSRKNWVVCILIWSTFGSGNKTTWRVHNHTRRKRDCLWK